MLMNECISTMCSDSTSTGHLLLSLALLKPTLLPDSHPAVCPASGIATAIPNSVLPVGMVGTDIKLEGAHWQLVPFTCICSSCLAGLEAGVVHTCVVCCTTSRTTPRPLPKRVAYKASPDGSFFSSQVMT